MTTKEKQGFGLYFLLAFGLAWLCQVGGCMALLQKQNAVLYQLALVATMLCPLLAVLLALRGYADPMQARAFLSGGDQSAFDPMLLQDMDKAVARIRTAIERRENVAVFGDYDVDGITSTCVLTDYLRRQGVPVHPYIPDRIEEGYGLNMDAITNLQRTSDITLIITVDCGITAIDETNYALQRGIDMVITDHHECSGQAIPNACLLYTSPSPRD